MISWPLGGSVHLRRPLALSLGLVLSAVVVSGPVSAAPAAGVPTLGAASRFTPLAPVRVLDTRSGSGPVGPGGTVTLDLSAQVPAGATAAVLNLTATEPTAATFVAAYPTGQPRPDSSNLNVAAGETRPNAVTVRLGPDRRVDLYNSAGSVHLVADLAGYYGPQGSKYAVLDPVRVLDTRTGPGPVGPQGTISLDLSARIPATATAVVFNLTGTEPTANTFVTAYPHGQRLPVASNLNLVRGQTSPNLVTVQVGTDRKVDLYNQAGNTHLIADLAGYYDPGADTLFVPSDPIRLLDTRTILGGPIGPAATYVWHAWAAAPKGTIGVLANLTGTAPTTFTYLAAAPSFNGTPTVSNVNLDPGQTAANLVSVRLGTDGDVQLYNAAGSTHAIVDVAGYFLRTCAGTNGCVFAWGEGTAGQLGDGSTQERGAPKPVANLSDVIAVDGGDKENLALRSDGTVWAWGVGLDVPGGSSGVPVRVPGLTDVTQISAGQGSGLALRSDGTVWAWGSDDHGQLGDGVDHGPNGSPTPVRVVGLTDVASISISLENGYAARSDGTVWSWGDNSWGQLGNGTSCVPNGNCQSNVPVQVSGLTGVTAVSDDGFALRSDGTVWTWGQGALGANLPAPQKSLVPVQVSGLTGVVKISGNMQDRYALKSDGTVWAWGSSRQGALGNGTTDVGYANVPVQVSGITNATAIGSSPALNGYAVTAGGQVLAWGDNINSALGGGMLPFSAVPIPVQGLSRATAVSGYVTGAIALVPHPTD